MLVRMLWILDLRLVLFDGGLLLARADRCR